MSPGNPEPATAERLGPLPRSALDRVPAAAYRTIAQIIISGAVLYWVVTWVRLSETPIPLGDGDWVFIGLVWLLQSLLPFLQAERWRLIAATLGARLPFRSALENVYIGQFFNQVLPSAIGGDAVRIWKLRRLLPLQVALNSVACDRIVALVAVPVILAIGSGLLFRIVPEGPLRWSLAAILAASACAILMLVLGDRVPLPAALRRMQVVSILLSAPVALRRLFSDPLCLVRTILLSLCIHAGVGVSFWMLALGLDAQAPLAAFLVLTPLVTLITMLPISVGGWGIREGAMVTALGLMGIEPSIALAVSIQFGLIMMVVGLPGGALTFASSMSRRRERQG